MRSDAPEREVSCHCVFLHKRLQHMWHTCADILYIARWLGFLSLVIITMSESHCYQVTALDVPEAPITSKMCSHLNFPDPNLRLTSCAFAQPLEFSFRWIWAHLCTDQVLCTCFDCEVGVGKQHGHPYSNGALEHEFQCISVVQYTPL